MKVEGYAVMFNDWTLIGGDFWESIRPGAFKKTLKDKREKFLIHHHDYKTVLASTENGTLRLREDSKGLFFSADLPDTQAAHDLSALIKRKDIRGMSFAFLPNGADGEIWRERKNYQLERELLDLELFEITITPTPAYKNTSVAVRSVSDSNANATAAKRRMLKKLKGAKLKDKMRH